jgi:hypothetical protein
MAKCSICKLVFVSDAQLHKHKATQEHKNKIRDTGDLPEEVRAENEVMMTLNSINLTF